MRNRKKLNYGFILAMAFCLVIWGIIGVALATTFSDTYDTNTPQGSDNPAEADDRMREIKAAVQERENVDHYWPLTGTEVSDADTGEHRKVLFHEPITSPATVAENHGQLFIKDVDSKAELHWIDEDEQELQLTSLGFFASPPAGVINAYGGSSAPSGWLLCDGSTGLSTVANPEYVNLFAIIGTTYGGTGTTDFDLPDLRGRIPVGLDAANVNLDAADALGETGGEEEVTLTQAELAEHFHGIAGETGNVDDSLGGSTAAFGIKRDGSRGTQANTQDAGTNTPHNNLQPYLTINYIIKI